jgi:hypothetical protein
MRGTETMRRKVITFKSLQLFQKASSPVNVEIALVKNNLGGLRFEAGQYQSASDFFRQAIREIEIASGPENPVLVRPLVNLAGAKT